MAILRKMIIAGQLLTTVISDIIRETGSSKAIIKTDYEF
jgi:hypothetical protein